MPPQSAAAAAPEREGGAREKTGATHYLRLICSDC